MIVANQPAKLVWLTLISLLASVLPNAPATTRCYGDDFVIVVGAGGTPEYAAEFEQWAASWQTLAEQQGGEVIQIGPAAKSTSQASDRDELIRVLATLAAAPASAEPLWLVLIGHGTFQNNVANLNLRGPDISAAQLVLLLSNSDRPLVVINNAAASGPFIAALSGENRTIITATRAGDELNFAHFGRFLADAISNPVADLDHDDRISILEAFLLAASLTERFYEQDDRLLTEHALIDDNGDKLGTPPSFFRGTRLVQEAAADQQPDGRRAARIILTSLDELPTLTAEQQVKVGELEIEIEKLRDQKKELPADEYYRQLEVLLLELAKLEQRPAS